MPQKSTLSSGPMTSRRRFPRAAMSCSALGRPDEVAAGLFIRIELDEALLLRIFEEVRERLESIVRLVESGFAALERLLHHRAPDLLARAALGDERVQRLDHQVEGFLLLVFRGSTLAPLLGGTALLLILAHQVVVEDELVAVGDEQIGA